MEAGVFFAELLFDNGERQIRLDSRTSDAIAIALRAGCPIFTTEEILQEAGVVIETNNQYREPVEEDDDAQNRDLQFQDLSSAELQDRLKDSIAEEDYEFASKIRDELKQRGVL